MVVLSIIVIITAIALPNLRRMRDQGTIAKAKNELRILQSAVENFYMHNNRTYPTGLAALLTAAPQIVKAIPNDPFTDPVAGYVYSRSTNTNYFVIYSIGQQANGSVAVDDSGVLTEVNPASCIYVSNAGEDSTP